MSSRSGNVFGAARDGLSTGTRFEAACRNVRRLDKRMIGIWGARCPRPVAPPGPVSTMSSSRGTCVAKIAVFFSLTGFCAWRECLILLDTGSKTP